jgi:hypothetical protein
MVPSAKRMRAEVTEMIGFFDEWVHLAQPLKIVIYWGRQRKGSSIDF